MQAAAAVATSWALLAWLHADATSWGVISALFVLQQSSDGTLKAAAERFVGTLTGSLVGLAAVALLPGDPLVLPRLALAAGLVTALATLRPDWRYAAVAAAIIALEPGASPLAGATGRALAIGWGSLCGVAAALLVWPESAAHRTRRWTGRALGACGELVDYSLRRATAQDAPELSPIHDRYLRFIRNAREASEIGRKRPHDPAPGELVESVQRLWHSQIQVERVASRDEAADFGVLAEPLDDVRRVLGQRLERLRSCLALGLSPDSSDEISEALARARSAVTELPSERRTTADALVFAVEEICSDLDRLTRLFAETRDR